jgi:hypothetical protein
VMPESKERMRSRSSCTKVNETVEGISTRVACVLVKEGGAPLLLWTISPAPRWWVPAGEAATGLLLCANPRRARQKMGRGGW